MNDEAQRQATAFGGAMTVLHTQVSDPRVDVDLFDARHDPDGPFCHILDENKQPLCGEELRPTRLRRIHLITECPAKGCVRCPECARLHGERV